MCLGLPLTHTSINSLQFRINLNAKVGQITKFFIANQDTARDSDNEFVVKLIKRGEGKKSCCRGKKRKGKKRCPREDSGGT